MKKSKILYRKNSTGKLQQWQFGVEGSTVHIWHGQVEGKIQHTKDVIKEGKNLGRANATTAEEQALAEAKSKYLKMKKKGYVTDKETAMKGDVDAVIEGGIIPMLAQSYKKKMKFPVYVQPKLDGIRALYKEGLWSRTRKRITSLPHIENQILSYFEEDVLLDGEVFTPTVNEYNKTTKEIKLSSGDCLVIDAEDLDKLKDSTPVLAPVGYAVVRYNQTNHYVHRLVMNAKKGEYVDHINRNKLDCRKVNLRIVTNSQNMANSTMKSNNTSGYKGVSWFKPKKKWCAEITKNYKKVHIGYFDDVVEAALAYDHKAVELFGEYACTNFPIAEKIGFEKLVSAVTMKKGVAPHHKEVQYHIYDLPMEGVTFEERYIILERMFEELPCNTQLRLVEARLVHSHEELMQAYEDYMEKGYEGAMARDPKGLYENPNSSYRSKNLQKIKEMQDAEFRIVGFNEGKGKLAGHVATFEFEMNDKFGKRTFKAKPNGSTSMLKKYFEDYSLWQGRWMTVQFQGYTKTDNKPRFPVALRFREMGY